MKLRAFYITTGGQLEALLKEINSNPDLENLRDNPKFIRKALEARDLVKAALAPFRRTVLATTTTQEIKKLEKEQVKLAMDLHRMSDDLKPKLEVLDKEVKRIQAMRNCILDNA